MQIDPLPNGADNQFYEITNERIGIHINNQIVIGGRTVRVMKFMVEEKWSEFIIPGSGGLS